MTKKELNQVYYLNKEIEMWKQQLAKINLGIPNLKVDGMPRSQRSPDETGDNIVNAADIESRINSLLEELLIKQKCLIDFISSIDDSVLRQILNYRCLQLKPWNDVADLIGGCNTSDSVRQMFHRNFN
ncbi:MAG: hypothetical protein RSE61_05715 [Anaerovoracaceae bacterium]